MKLKIFKFFSLDLLKLSKNTTVFVLLSLFVLQGCKEESSVNSFRIVFMTDIHVQPERKAEEGFRTAIAKVNELKPDIVITGGDLIMDALGQDYERSTMLYELYNEVSKEFNMPVYNTLGNHEVFGLYEDSGVSPDHPEYGKAMFKKRLGENKTYHSFDHKNWHIILLDAIGFTEDRHYMGEIDSVQLEWLINNLKNVNAETPILVSTHIPFVSVGEQMWRGGTTPLSSSEVIINSKEVLEVFKNYNLRLVLQGHLHIVEEIIFYDTHFITGGAVCGRWWRGSRSGFKEGFVVIDIENEDFEWFYQTYGWEAVEEM
ncbi:metallophosphoesterase family protein [Bacteroidota bacterium]